MKRLIWLALIAAPLVALGYVAIVHSQKLGHPEMAPAAEPQLQDEAPPLKVQVTPWGPTQEMLDGAKTTLASQAQVRRALKGARSRMLSLELIVDDDKTDEKPNAEATPPNRYRGIFYDYTNNVTIVAESSFDRPEQVNVTTTSWQPQPSAEEMDEALEILKADPTLGPGLLDERVQAYPPMPPLYFPEKSKGKTERIINVGLLAKDASDKSVERANEVVAVNLSQQTVLRFPSGAPPTSKASPTASCGPASSGSSTGRGVAGQFNFVITDPADGSEVWNFLAIRPSASSGVDASGIELQNVKYKGKLVLKRAHVPILNVQYDGNTCGPFRDWEYAESQFNADPTNGTTVTPGVRSCTVPATTQLDTSVDSGNFQGIAFYGSGASVTLVSEMSAGWYRYISEWNFSKDGVIGPRFGMGATLNSCTCNGHVHHAYWRFDFDIDNSSPNRVVEGGPPRPRLPLDGVIKNEMRRYRDHKGIFWTIENPNTHDAYKIVPNLNDGTAISDAYGGGDLWFLSYSATEIDDSGVASSTAAGLNSFVNGQKMQNTDLVVWYGIHIDHNRAGGQIMGHPNIAGQFVAGPDLVPVHW